MMPFSTYFKLITVNIFVWITFLIPLCISIIYRTLINFYLKIKIGNSYGGIFNAADSVMFAMDNKLFCITTVLYIKSKKRRNFLMDFKRVINDKVFKHPESYPKLTSTRRTFCGYSYYLKNSCTIDDVVVPIQISENKVFNEETLKDVTAEIINANQPKNNSVLWDIHVSPIPLETNDKDVFVYPVVNRFHHAIGDGLALIVLLTKLFGSENYVKSTEKFYKNFSSRIKDVPNKKSKNLLNLIPKYFQQVLEIIFISLGRLTETNHLKLHNKNALCMTSTSSEKIRIVAWSSETKPECLKMIKFIKSQTETKFVAVLNTAISASFTKYFEQNFYPVPENISGTISIMNSFPNLDYQQSAELENNATGFFISIPTLKSKKILNVLKEIDGNLTSAFNYTDNLVAFFFSKYAMGLFPKVLIDRSLGIESLTYFTTNIPANNTEFVIFDDCVVEKMIPLAPMNIRKIGIGIIFVSYNEKLQVGVIADNSVLKSQKEAQQIADTILETIKLLYNRLKSDKTLQQ